ncbi:MAG: isoprenylcysteine carboxylmethyltransferase family protein [Candidatus Omnitrophica bacterium]|nr:isoprenylcysteine carboxylmethyltransferase family protein [Candidatus Omnitrophota bacterium]
MDAPLPLDPWVVRAGRWLTKRRSVLLSPLFTAALLTARPAGPVWLEIARDLLGVACLLGGTRLRLVAASYHDSSHRSEPITAGPYAWVRHPLYLSNFLLGLGIVLVAGWWPMVAVYTLAFLPLHILIARSEEVHLTGLYGAKYEAYRRAVLAVLPLRRFRGTPYGSPNPFKLKKGKEGLKAVGYLAGMAAILVFKQWRQGLRLPALRPLPSLYGVAAVAAAVMAVVIRPRLRSNVLRACQTVLAVVCVCLLVIHLPGVWSSAPGVSAPAAAEVRQEPPAAAVPVPLPPRASLFVHVEDVRPQRSLWGHLAEGFWSNVELLAGVGGFGVAALSDGAFQSEPSVRGHEFQEAGQVALASAVALSVLAQLHRAHANPAFPVSDREAWRMRVYPEMDKEGNLAVLAALKRRF